MLLIHRDSGFRNSPIRSTARRMQNTPWNIPREGRQTLLAGRLRTCRAMLIGIMPGVALRSFVAQGRVSTSCSPFEAPAMNGDFKRFLRPRCEHERSSQGLFPTQTRVEETLRTRAMHTETKICDSEGDVFWRTRMGFVRGSGLRRKVT